MTRIIATVASLLCLCMPVGALAPASTSVSPANGFFRIGIGAIASNLKVKKKAKSGSILPCMDSWACSGCFAEGGIFYNWTESFLNNCCACLPSLGDCFNCNPDCCRTATSRGFNSAAAGVNKDSGWGVPSFGYGFASSIFSESVDPSSSDEDTLFYSQTNPLFNLHIGLYALVASLDAWAIYLGSSLLTNPLCNGSRYLGVFENVISNRKKNKEFYQNIFTMTFGPRFEYMINPDFSLLAGIEAGFARISNYIPQSEAADRIIGVKNPYVIGALAIYFGFKTAINDDVALSFEAGRTFFSESAGRSLQGRNAKYLNVHPGSQMKISVGLEFLV